LNGNVRVVYSAVSFVFRCEVQLGCTVLRSVRTDWMSASWGVKGQEDIIHISEIVNDPCLYDRRARCMFSLCCKKSSAIKPDKGAPIARPSCWDIRSWLWEK